MQNTTKWKESIIAFSLLSIFSSSALSDDNKPDEQQIKSSFGGNVSVAYDTNIYHKDDHRSVRNISWNGSLHYSFASNYRAYLSSGGYRALEDKTGDYFTDSVIGISRSNLFEFGDTATVGINGQFTIPTSETSRKDELITAFRVAVPLSFQISDANISVSPRLRKNFHKYQTAGGKSLTEWVYSLSTSASYSFQDLTVGISALAGNSISYQGTRRNSITYGGSVFGSYQLTDAFSFSLSASTSGFYLDAEKGTLGDIDIFDADRASYEARISYSF
ncbi:hypothetical protein [Vibrio japonicus]|uniref:Outer membrane receptor protein n=1 Tax=Vibrio japonicus TaxID=1824638 RepID=A0ABY5LKM5_9VIBR|nr:hypothetical protein [Vibrio japonicus]UUM31388.1 hypothetical protein NP165_04445 [Vibrio japonicus]